MTLPAPLTEGMDTRWENTKSSSAEWALGFEDLSFVQLLWLVLCSNERINTLFLYCRFLQSEAGRKGAHVQMWNKFKALSSGNTHNMTLFVIPIYTFIH